MYDFILTFESVQNTKPVQIAQVSYFVHFTVQAASYAFDWDEPFISK